MTEKMIGYCPECQKCLLYRYKKEEFINDYFATVRIGFICLNCGSLIELSYDLAEVKLVEKGNLNLSEKEKKEIRKGLGSVEVEIKPEKAIISETDEPELFPVGKGG